MLNKFILTTTAAILISGSAMAADAVIYNEPPLADINTFTWTGAYIGVNAGYGFGRIKEVGGDGDGEAIKPKGFIGGVQAGYNWQFDQLIAGIETDFQGSAMKDSEDDFEDLDSSEVKIKWFGTVRGRLGYNIAERTLLYGTAGLAYGKFSFNQRSFNNRNETTSVIGISDTRAGYTVGGGLEYAFTDNVTLKGEYLYTDLGKSRFGDRNDQDSVNTKITFSTVRIGVNYKF